MKYKAFIAEQLFLCLIFIFQGSAQTPKLDSLINQLNIEHSQEGQLQTVINICSRNYSLSDSILIKYITLGEKLASPQSPEFYRIQTVKCLYLGRRGAFDETVTLIDSLLKTMPSDKKFINSRLRLINSKVSTLIRKGQTKEAIENSFVLLSESEREKDTIRVLAAYAMIGWANMELGNYNDAIKWLKTGIAYTNDSAMLMQASYLFSNIASCYNNVQKVDTAFYFINLALKCTRADENLTGIANALNIRADMYMKQKNFAAAEQDMEEALKMREQIGDIMFVVSDMAQLSSFYASINETDKGIAIAQKGIAIARERNNLSKLIFLYTALAENYQKANNKDEYANTLLQIVNLKDSLYQKNSAQAIADMEAKYDVAKKEKIIVQQNLILTKRNYLFYGSIAFFMMVGVITFLVFNQYRQRQRSIALRAVSGAKEEERKRIAAELHDNIGTQLSYISRKIEFVNSNTSSFNTTQHALLEDINESAHNTISDLRETIWALKKEEISLHDLADRLKTFTHHQLSNHPAIELLINENIETKIFFSSIESLNIFRICQEAINNAAQHSAAKQIHLQFMARKNGEWRISIADNGKGFDTKEQFENHFGIENMQQRAKEINAILDLSSDAGTGTIILLYKLISKK